MNEMHNLTRRKYMLLGCITAFLAVAATSAVLEIYVRATREHEDLYVLTGRIAGGNPMRAWAFADPFCAYRPKPGLFASDKTVNSHGFLSTPELPVRKPNGVVRLVFLDESSTAGTGYDLADADTWPWQTVERARAQVDQPIDFINAAACGYTSFESYGRLWSWLRHFGPDIVVVCHGWNEMYYFGMTNSVLSWRRPNNEDWSISRTRKPVAIYAPLWLDRLFHRSQLFTRIRIRLARPVGGELGTSEKAPLATDFDHERLSVWRTHLRLIRAACDVIGARLFVVKPATLIVPGLSAKERQRCRYEYHGFDHDAHVAAFSEIYRVIDEEIPKDSVIDATSLSGRPEFFYDHIHPTPQGCAGIARIVADALVPCIRDAGSRHASAPRGDAAPPGPGAAPSPAD